jgi:hypothetical protein
MDCLIDVGITREEIMPYVAITRDSARPRLKSGMASCCCVLCRM